jgi:hypothetical protein
MGASQVPRAAIAIISLGLGVSCKNAPPEVVREAGNVRFYEVEGATPACAGSAPYLDRAAAAVSDSLGLPIQGSLNYHYRPDETELPCVDDDLGCANSNTAEMWARAPDEVHEVVHAILAQHHLNAGVPFFIEGLAHALGNREWSDRPLSAGLDLEQLLAAKRLDDDQRKDAALVATYLLRNFGPARFIELARKTSTDPAPEDTRRAFRDSYGTDLTQVIADIQAAGSLPNHLAVSECAAPTMEPVTSLPLTCEGNGIGAVPATDPPTTYLRRRLPLDAAGAWTLRLSAGESTPLMFFGLWDCRGAHQQSTFAAGSSLYESERLLLAFLPDEDRALWMTARVGSPVEPSFTLARTSAAATSGCVNGTLVVPQDVNAIDLETKYGSTALWALSSESARVGTLYAGTRLELCADGCGNACETKDAGAQIDFPAGTTLWIRPQTRGSILFSSKW